VNLARLSLAYLGAKPLNTALNLVLLALGVGTIALVLLATDQVEERMGRDARGIDLVVGAKGSPMQLILSAVFHVDAPTGNIPLKEAKQLAQNRAIRKAIPLALGDSFRGFRIVGTTHEYVAHYEAELGAGRLWQAPMEAVLGAETAAGIGLGVGGQFVGAHGLGEGGDRQPRPGLAERDHVPQRERCLRGDAPAVHERAVAAAHVDHAPHAAGVAQLGVSGGNDLRHVAGE